MTTQDKFRCGFVTLFGRPNVGKSTLVNALVGEKVSIVSQIPQTTRYLIRAILNRPLAQAIFVDVPGFHLFRHRLCRYLNQTARQALEGVDLILYVVDVSRRPQREEREIMKLLAGQNLDVIMVLNKIDQGKKYLGDYLELWPEIAQEKKQRVKYFIPVSAKRGDNLGRLEQALIESLPYNEPYYPSNCKVDFPQRLRLADLIREACFLKVKEELPHDLAVYVEEIEEKERFFHIRAVIYVNRSSQKAILIGKKANFIKEIGTLARQQIEAVLKKKVFLELRVKNVNNWQENARILRQLEIDT